MTEKAYLIALLPLFSFLIIVFFLRWREKVSSLFSIGMILVSWVMSLIVLIERLSGDGTPYEWYYTFVQFTGFHLEIGILIDSLTAVMLMVVTTVGACVEIYSIGYMKDDPRFSRFFAYLSLFLFSMLGLVLANNFFMIFIFWELVGLTSYLLIGFWFEKKSAADACKKAFITTRIGDLGFIGGLLMIGVFIGTFNYGEVFKIVQSGAVPSTVLTIAAIGVFCGAVGKSAQFPLHVWLPDAMEGPTPVSALIHAATMVAAGVYLVARSMTLFVGSPTAAMVVAAIGLITSFLAAFMALTQFDIKRILAYSTVSQLGYMIMALGLYGVDVGHGHHSAGYVAGTLHLMTHAFFKGLLFLGAGSVIHAVHTNDIRLMGGLLPKTKITGTTFLIASLSIAGIFPLSGFWSKDEIIVTSLGHPVFFVGTLLIAFMTAFYMWRLCFMTFFGKPRDEHRFEHAHESPRVMTWPLAFLAFLSVFAGWVALPWLHNGYSSFVYHGEVHHASPNYLLMLTGTAVALSGIYLAYLMYYKGSISPVKMGERFKLLYRLSFNKCYFDEIYFGLLINPITSFAKFLWSFDAKVIDGAVNGTAWLTILWSDIKMWFDKWIIDGAVNGSGWVVHKGAHFLKYLQTGSVQFYALCIIALVVFFGISNFEFFLIDREQAGWPMLTVLFAVAVIGSIIAARSSKNRRARESESDQ